MPDRCILAVKYTPAGAPRSLRRTVSGFLRYIQYRDREPEEKGVAREAEGVIKYVAHRDRSASRALLFDRQGTIGDDERRRLTSYVAHSLQGSRPQVGKGTGNQAADRRRAVYRFVLSPEQANGLDLRRLTLAAMAQLESDLGTTLPPWLAAEHRNTKHPHVHVVLAARLEVSPGRFRGVMVTRQRLQSMKDALSREIERQRGLGSERLVRDPVVREPMSLRTDRPTHEMAATRPKDFGQALSTQPSVFWRTQRPRPRLPRRPASHHHRLAKRGTTTWLLRRLAADYRWQAEREALEALRSGHTREAFA